MQEYKLLSEIVYNLDYKITKKSLVILFNLLLKMDCIEYKVIDSLKDEGNTVENYLFKDYEKLEAFLDWYFSWIIQNMFKFELYCGLKSCEHTEFDLPGAMRDTLRTGAMMDVIKATEFIIREASILKLDITAVNTAGSYTNTNNKTIAEEGFLITIIGNKDLRPRVKELAYIYKVNYKQECVLYVETEVRTEMIY